MAPSLLILATKRPLWPRTGARIDRPVPIVDTARRTRVKSTPICHGGRPHHVRRQDELYCDRHCDRSLEFTLQAGTRGYREFWVPLATNDPVNPERRRMSDPTGARELQKILQRLRRPKGAATMRMIVTMMAGCVVLAMASGVGAQMQPMTPGQSQSSGSSEQSSQQSHGPMMGSGMMGQHMMGQGMMGQGMMGHEMMGGMMCPMMGEHMMGMGMGPRMMGGMMGSSDPKAMARMLKLRGDILKAIGEVMVKHAQEMEQAK
jgi:hypothetical protein